MASMKYIRHTDLGMVIFEPHIEHLQMALKLPGPIQEKITGAGFVNVFNSDLIGCSGESVSLRIKSTPSDNEHIKHLFRGY